MLTDTEYYDRMKSAEGWAHIYANGDSRRYAWLAISWINRHMLDISEVAVEHYGNFEDPEEEDLIGECEDFFAHGDDYITDMQIALEEGTCDEDFVDWKCEDFLDDAKDIAKRLGMALKYYDRVWD